MQLMLAQPMQLLVLAVALSTATAYQSGAVNTSVGKESKMAAVKRVAAMLKDLQTRVLQEGEEEAATYNKFSCFCKDTMKEKSDAITEGENSQTALRAKIMGLDEDREEADVKIDGWVADIEVKEKELETLKTERNKEVKEYQANEADLVGAVEALQGAIQSLKAAKTPSLAQLKKVSNMVRMADALGLGGQALQSVGAALLTQEAPEVPTEAYSFKSGDIITTLEGLLADFKGKKNEIDQAEVTAAHTFDTTSQDLKNQIATKNRDIDRERKEKAKLMERMATASQDLTVTSATLLDDKAYITELSTMCSNKAKTWDARSGTRQDELSALTAAIDIIQNHVSNHTSAATIRFAQRSVRVAPVEAVDLQDVEASAEAAAEDAEAKLPGAPLAFLQHEAVAVRHLRGQHVEDGRQTVINLLRSEGKHLQSAMLTSLASNIAQDPFAKVKTLLQELIERLLKQASNEATQKGWCDKSMSDAQQKRDFAAEEIRELNGNLAELEARHAKLVEELARLADETSALEKEQDDADADRATEKAENQATVAEATSGRDAVQGAIQLLDRFYKAAAKGQVNLTLVQRGPAADDAPDAGFGAGEAYAGAQGAAEGVLGLLEVIHSDFTRTKTETEKAEKQAVQDHLDFTTRTQSSIAEKKTATNEKNTQKDDAEDQESSAKGNLETQTNLLKGAIEELIELKGTCVDTAMSYEDRAARREEEIAALKKAECILTSYEQYGPDAAVSSGC